MDNAAWSIIAIFFRWRWTTSKWRKMALIQLTFRCSDAAVTFSKRRQTKQAGSLVADLSAQSEQALSEYLFVGMDQ